MGQSFSTTAENPQVTRAESYARIERILETGPYIPGLPRVIHRAHFLYEPLWWSQAGARISEMNDLGWVITSVELPKSLWRRGIRTGYRLDGKPLKPGQDWYVEKTGQPRPSLAGKPAPSTTKTFDLPLFDRDVSKQ